jgi:hypothetical protein
MSCGPGKGLEGLQKELDAAKEAIAGLQGDLAGGIDGLQAKLESMAAGVMGGMKSMMPTIELPELPDLSFELPELKLPEIPVIDSLQKGMGDLLEIINDPFALLKIGGPKGLDEEIAKLKEKFGDKIPDFDSLIGDLLSGKIDADSLCKLVPNLEIDQDNPDVVAEKATPVTAPETDAEKIPEPDPAPVSKKAVNDVPTDAATDVTADGKTRTQQKEAATVDKEIQSTRSEQVLTVSEQEELNKRLLNNAYRNSYKYLAAAGGPLVSANKQLSKKVKQGLWDLTWPELWIEVFNICGEEPYKYGKLSFNNLELRIKQRAFLKKHPKIVWDFQKDGQILAETYALVKKNNPRNYSDADDFETAARQACERAKSKAVK